MANKKKATAKKTSASPAKREKRINQVAAIIWIAAALFLFAVAVYPGQKLWNGLHKGMLGLFGFMSFVYPVYIITVSAVYSFGKLHKRLKIKFAEIGTLMFLINTAADVFVLETSGYFVHYSEAFTAGASLKGGGALGAVLGNALGLAFGKVGAVITVIILIAALVMLITGTTVANLVSGVSKVKKDIEDPDNFKEKEEKPSFRKKFNVDVAIDEADGKKAKPEVKKPDKTETENNRENIDEKGRRVIDAYNGFASDKPADTVPEEEKPEKIKMTPEETEQEIKKVEGEINGNIISVSEDEGYKFPPISLLKAPKYEDNVRTGEELDSTANHLVETLRSFGVETKIVDISRGPTVTRYELQPCAGVKISKITNLADDIALNLATAGVRIEAPIPNKAAVGIEVPNKNSNVVGVREIIESSQFRNAKSKLTVALGKDIAGNAIVADIAKMPHGLIAGATGSGKSVCINSIIMSILYKAGPDDVKLLMIDPKVVELGVYNDIPHLLVPVVTDPRKASGALGWAVQEMEARYRLFAETGVRDLDGYNRLCEENDELVKKPQIVIIIDELADLMMTAPNEVEDSINRIAAKARAAGMHLIIATQRPSVDVVTGVIKANIPTRIAFAVSSQIDSRTILDMIGAEKLLGRGDMLFNPMGASKPTRVQGCFVSDGEVEAVVEYVKGKHNRDYDTDIQSEIDKLAAQEKKGKGTSDECGDGQLDDMFDAAVEAVIEQGQASTSLLQRKLKLGYGRAARIIDQMEECGIVGPYEGSKPRKVLIDMNEWLEKKSRES